MVLKILKKFKEIIVTFYEYLYLFIFSTNKNFYIKKNLTTILLKYKKKKKLTHWEKVEYSVAKKIYYFGLDNFLRIREIQDAMFVKNEDNFERYLNLINLKKDHRYIIENSFGNPILSKKLAFTSINKIHQFHHLKFLQFKHKRKLSTVFIELGGGYGLLCSLVFQIFKVKKYIIFDMNVFSFIQKIYLKKILNKENFNKIEFINDINRLQKLVKYEKKFNFFAFWSLSEMNIKFRNKFVNIIKKSNIFLLGYQAQFNKINNSKYFNGFISKFKDCFDINITPHPCYRENFYLYAKRK